VSNWWPNMGDLALTWHTCGKSMTWKVWHKHNVVVPWHGIDNMEIMWQRHGKLLPMVSNTWHYTHYTWLMWCWCGNFLGWNVTYCACKHDVMLLGYKRRIHWWQSLPIACEFEQSLLAPYFFRVPFSLQKVWYKKCSLFYSCILFLGS